MPQIALHFDFISPYSYLALAAAPGFAARTGARFDLRPVVYAKLLDATGLVGPAEIGIKRRAMLADIVRCAHLQGVPLVGPPAHPFRSLEALRTVMVFKDEPRVLELAVALSTACWGEGRDLTDMSVIADVVQRCGFDGSDLAARTAAPAVKEALALSTQRALEAGVFGVPTFLVDGELFWGQDRMGHLAEYLAGRLPPASSLDVGMAHRPRAAERHARP